MTRDPFWTSFDARGGVNIFGFPVSRTFTFLGCTTQFFQRQLMQQCGALAPGGPGIARNGAVRAHPWHGRETRKDDT